MNTEELRNKLIHRERMAALGLLAGGIAHEINNPVNYILNSVRPLQKNVNTLIEGVEVLKMICEMEKSEQLRMTLERMDLQSRKITIDRLAENISEGAERISRIVEDMLTFSRDKPEQKLSIPVPELTESVISLFFSQYSSRIRFSVQVPQHLTMYGNPGELSQIFVNVISNSVQALGGDSGTVFIEGFDDDAEATVRFEDNGPGITPGSEELLFEPFYTTRPEGTGLGLSISRQIAEKHGGSLDIRNGTLGGACVTLRIPKFTFGMRKDDS